jgi:hypothetical protein
LVQRLDFSPFVEEAGDEGSHVCRAFQEEVTAGHDVSPSVRDEPGPGFDR